VQGNQKNVVQGNQNNVGQGNQNNVAEQVYRSTEKRQR